MKSYYSKKFLLLLNDGIIFHADDGKITVTNKIIIKMFICVTVHCLNWGLGETSLEFKFWVHLVSLHSAELWWGHTQQGLYWGHQLISFRIIHCQIVATFTVTLRWTESSKPMAKEKNKIENLSFFPLLSVKEWK